MKLRNLILAFLLLFGWSNGFAKTATTITEGPLNLSLSAQKTNCASDASGSATATVIGGKSPYTYNWSNGETTATITNLVSGGYFITVTDALGSKVNSHVTVEASNKLQLRFNERPIACAYGSDGKVVVIPDGGVTPYTYLWGNGSTNSFIPDVSEGIYKVTVTDANGCRGEGEIEVEMPEDLRIKANYAHVSCGEEADGTMEVIASGGAGNYSFYWDLDKGGGTKREGLAPGLYSVTVTDGNGCTAMICPEVLQSKPPSLAPYSAPVTCPGGSDGRGTVSPQGDSPPYTFKWPNNESQYSTAHNLAAGTYTVTVTNFRNCSNTVDVVVGLAGGGFGFTIDSNGSTCGNVANGQASVNITGGVAPFTYSWVNVSSNTEISGNATIDGLSPGDYQIMVTDANGCSDTKTINISEKPVPTVTATATTGEVCFGESTGAINATASGGEGNITYQWSNGQSQQNIANLSAGTYTVTATDINGCTATSSVTIQENPEIIIEEEVAAILCNNQVSEKIEIIAKGGSGTGYTYEWSNGGTASSITNILAGTYFVTVTDSKGCKKTKGITITQPDPISISVTSNHAADLNSTDGSINVSVVGGKAPYTYSWNNGKTSSDLTNLAAGEYILTVTDANGCQQTTTVTIVANCTIIVSIKDTRATLGEICFGESTGALGATASGGEGTITYKWSNGQSQQNIANLSAGTYTVTATDINGCTATSSVTIQENPEIIIEEQVSPLVCNSQAGGKIEITARGGSGTGYTYEWSNGGTTSSISNILAGTYIVTVTDSKGCKKTEGITITQPTPIIITATSSNAADINSTDGSINVSVSGGTAPYTYTWGNGVTSPNLTNLAAGEYTLTVTDANGCQQTTTVTVIATCTLMANITDTRATSCAGNDGSATVTTGGGTGPITFQWSNGAITSAIAGLTPGFYGVTVTDGNGCQYASGTIVGDACDCVQPVVEKVLVFEATCGKSDGSLEIHLAEDSNQFNYQWSSALVSGTKAKNLPAGAYTVTITDKTNHHCSAIETVNIGNSNIGPVIALQSEPETCNGKKGFALLVPGNLTYAWSDGGEGNFRDDLSAGTYFVTATIPGFGIDECMDIVTVKIGLESGLTITPEFGRLPDCGLANGSVTIKVTGGSGNYSYSWGAATQNNLPAGIYNIVVTDNNTGCTDFTQFTVLENVPTVSITIDSISNATCAGSIDGDVRFIMVPSPDFVGGEVIIADGSGKEYTNGKLPAGNYCLVAKDANGCAAGQACFEITEPELLFVDVTLLPKTCSQETAILLTTTGGNGFYTYDWKDLDGEIDQRDRKGVPNGTYEVTVKDQGGCSLNIPNLVVTGECFICELEVTAKITQLPSCDLANGAATISVDNVFGNLTYSWGDGGERTDLTAGTYTVTVTDDHRGCEEEVSFTLTEPELPMEATISKLTQCPDATGQLEYDLSNFKCFKQPLSVVITDDQGTIYDENALPVFQNYIFIVRDADGAELNRQFFSVDGFEPIISDVKVTNAGCTTLGAIDLSLAGSADNYTINWEDLATGEQTIDRTNLSEGTYKVTIFDNANTGCDITQNYVVGKNEGFAANIDPVALTCDGEPVQLFLEGEEIVSYEWSPTNLITEGQGTATPTISPEGNGVNQVTVLATNNFGCTVTKKVDIFSIQTNPDGGISSSPQCNGLTFDFSSESVSSDFYLWDFGDGNTSEDANPTHTYDVAGDYVVKLKLKPNVPCAEEKGVIASRDLKVVADAITEADFTVDYDPCRDKGMVSFLDASVSNPGTITSWKWDFGNGITSTEQNPVIELTKDEELEVILEITTTIGCDGSVAEMRSFKFNSLPEFPESLQICPGTPTELNPNPQEGVSYLWSPAELLDDPTAANPIATTTKPVDFTVVVTQGDCVVEEKIKANVPKEQEYNLAEDEEVCDEEERLIFVEAPTTSMIEWTTNGEKISEDAEIMVTPGVYDLKLIDPNGCEVTDVVTIDNHAIDALIEDNTNACDGGIGTLVVTNSNEEDLTYAWVDAEGIISPELTTNEIEIEPSETTDYEVTVKNEFGCETTLNQTVKVSMIEDMIVVPEQDTIFSGETTLINISPDGDYSVSWSSTQSLDDLASFRPTASPTSTTTYTVTIVDNETGCRATKTVTVFVKEVECGEPNLFFPNAFSPNGDGYNDVLRIRGNAISEVHFVVYNRWGEKVFESNSKEQGWDGIFNGERVSSDVYAYYLRVVCLAGTVYETQGNVTVLN